MSIEKDIAIHGLRGVKSVLSYVTDEDHDGGKTDVQSYLASNFGIYDIDHMTAEEAALLKNGTVGISNLLSYAENIEKTAFTLDGDQSLLVSGVGCAADSAALAFQLSRENYYDLKGEAALVEPVYVDKETGAIKTKQSIECYHVIQSFPAIEGLDPRLVHRAGIEYAKRAFPGHKCVVTTHMNTEHLHNHIVVCAYHESEPRKFLMNMTTRREIRHINDQISYEFGLPILLDSDLNHNSTISYTEWEARRSGDLWKDRYRNDIRNIARISHNWDEFVTIMRQAGYQVNDERKYVTYRFLKPDPNDTRDFRKVRDKTLGIEFMRDALAREYSWNSKTNEPTHHVKRKARDEKPDLSVSRYSPTGRRRSDLELLFLFAIRIIQFFKDWFFDKAGLERSPDNPIYLPYQKRLTLMQHAAFAVQELGLDNKDQLKVRLDQAGAKLSHVRKELENVDTNLEYMQVIAEKIRTVKAVRAETEGISFDTASLRLHEPTEEQVYACVAREMPMKPQIKQRLHIKLEDNPQWKLKYDFSHVSHLLAQDIIAFLDGKNPEKPDCLITLHEFKQKRLAAKYEAIAIKKDQNLKEKHSSTPITSAMRKMLEFLKDTEGLDIDIDKLSMYDGMRVIGYFENRVNHYGNDQSYILSSQRERLEELLNRKDMKIARNTRFVLKSEYDRLIDYLETGKGRLPDLLKPDVPIRESDRIQLAELLEIKGESCVIPLDELTQLDGQKLMTYLLTKDTVPDVLKNRAEIDPEKQKDIDFANDLFVRPLQDRRVLDRYRNVLNDLIEHGIDPDKLDEILAQEKALLVTRDMLKAQDKDLSKEYRDLKRVETSLELANTPEFTHGPLFTKEELEPAETVEIREGKEQELEALPETPSTSQPISKEKELWDGLDELFGR